MGGKCIWDRERDTVVSFNMKTEEVGVSVQVFFVYIEDTEEPSEHVNSSDHLEEQSDHTNSIELEEAVSFLQARKIEKRTGIA